MTPTFRQIGSHQAMQHLPPPTIRQVISMDSFLNLSANQRKWWKVRYKKAVGLVRIIMDILCNLHRNQRSCPILPHAEHRGWVNLFRTIILLWRHSNSKLQPLKGWMIVQARKGLETLASFKANFSRIDRRVRKAHLWRKRRKSKRRRKHRNSKEVQGRLKYGAKGR